MTLFEIIDIFKKTALVQPNIRSASDGSVYDKLNTNPSIQYDVFHIQQTTHQEDFETDYYGLQLFYISRLEDSLEDNRLQIQSIGKEILGNIIRTFCENFGIDYPTITYTPFTQRFNDLTAGVYCNVRLEVPKEIICADDYIAEVVPGKDIKLQDIGITITENGLRVITADAEYDGIGEIRIETNVPQYPAELQYKEVEYTENGEYVVRPDQDYDGLTEVAVSVDVPDRYDEGYDDGKEDGIAEQKGKLTATTFTENNTYTIENGWSAVTVNVPSDYQEGYDDGFDDGEETQKAKLVPTAVTENGTYSRADGYSSFEVNVPATEDRYDEGYADGEAAQKAKLTSLSVSANGEYNREDGYSAITVNVPSDYQEGYDDGFDDGEATQKAKLTTLSVSANGEYTRADGYSAITVNVPAVTAYTDLDLIANLQGDYYVIPSGTTHLRDSAFYRACFSSITIPSSVTMIGTNAFRYTCLTGITIPDSVITVDSSAFANSSDLTEVHIGSGLTVLNNSTFSYCAQLEDITIPSGITRIGTSCFNGCSAMTAMTFEGVTPPTLQSNSSSLGSTAYTFPIYVPCQSLNAYKTAFGEYYAPRIQCQGSEIITALTLNVSSAITDSATATTTYSPSTAYTDIYYTSSDPTVATIDSGTGVITVVSEGNTTICAIDRISGLQDCKTVNTEKRLWLEISYNPDCQSSTVKYTTLTLSNGRGSYDMVTDGSKVVEGNVTGWTGDTQYTGTTTFYFRLTGTTINSEEFKKGNTDQIKSVVIPDGVTEIGSSAFAGQITMIGTYPCGLSSVTMPSTITTIGESAFKDCKSLRDYNLEDLTGLTVIPDSAFLGTFKTDIVIPNGVTRIGDHTFYNATAQSITFPATLQRIDSYGIALQGSSNKTLTFLGTTPPELGCCNFSINNLVAIYVPASAVDTYKSAWPEVADRITAITS